MSSCVSFMLGPECCPYSSYKVCQTRPNFNFVSISANYLLCHGRSQQWSQTQSATGRNGKFPAAAVQVKWPILITVPADGESIVPKYSVAVVAEDCWVWTKRGLRNWDEKGEQCRNTEPGAHSFIYRLWDQSGVKFGRGLPETSRHIPKCCAEAPGGVAPIRQGPPAQNEEPRSWLHLHCFMSYHKSTAKQLRFIC